MVKWIQRILFINGPDLLFNSCTANNILPGSILARPFLELTFIIQLWLLISTRGYSVLQFNNSHITLNDLLHTPEQSLKHDE